MRNDRLDESQARIKIARRNINNLRYVDDTKLMAESKEKLKSLLMKVCASSSLAFHMIYSVYKLNKQGENMQPLCTPFPVWNQSVLYPVLTVAS